jgi:hypothetical protein
MTTPGTLEHPPLVSISLISAAALGYEILLMRLFSIIQWHHFAYMIISLALLGYGASGTFIALARPWLLARFTGAYRINLALFGLSAVACTLAAQQLPINVEEILWDWHQALYLFAVYLLLALPFLFAANAVALALTRYRRAIARVYAADLTGAGLGSLGIILLLFLVFPGTALKLIGALGLLASLVAARELHGPHARWQAGTLLAALLLLALPGEWLTPQPSPYKALSQTLRIGGTRIIEQHSSPLGLISVVESQQVPLRHAPGLSLQSSAPLPAQLGVFTDADGMTAINRNPQGEALAYLDDLTSALPYYLAEPQRVLVLGAGAGADVQQALNHGVPRIDAVELNPQLIDLVREKHAEWAGQLYDHPAVRIYPGEARGFVRRSRDSYDLVQIALLDAFGASSSGLHALNESYLYTVEALQDYLERVAPGGYLAISRWIKLPPRDTLKLVATAVQALQASGITAPGERLALIRGWQTSTLLVKNGVFTTDEIVRLQAFCRTRAFDMAWYHGISADAVNRVNVFAQPWFYQAATALTGAQGTAFLERYKFDITPATDDRPYFFHFFKWDVLQEILALRGQGGLPLLEAGYLVLVATLLQSLVLSIVLILLPLLVLRSGRDGLVNAVRPGQVVVYFFAIGLAFLFVEIAFIQKFILFLHHPLYAVAIVLTAFLLFAGGGSAWTARRDAHPRLARYATVGAVSAIAVFGLLYLLLLDPVFAALMHLPVVIRILVAIALIAPLAFFMGMPFPLGLARVAAERPALVPWAWGINGCASVLSAVLATLLAIQFGFSVVIIAALLLYALATLVMH